MEQENYVEKIKNLSDEEVILDLSLQSYILAKGLSAKMKNLKTSVTFIFCSLGLLIVLIFLNLFCV
jgi:hypothetical protein